MLLDPAAQRRVGNRRDLNRRERPEAVVKPIQQQAAEVEDVAWEMETHDLPLPALHHPIAAHHAGQQQQAMRRPLAVPSQILTGADLLDIERQIFENMSLITRQLTELFQFPY